MRETVFLAALGIAAFTMIIVVKSIVAAAGMRMPHSPRKDSIGSTLDALRAGR